MLNNLNRIKRILSARLGTLVPKFNPGGKMYSKSLPSNITVYSKDGLNWFLDELCTQPYTGTDSMEFLLAAQQEIDIPVSIPGDPELTPTSAIEISAKLMLEMNQILSEDVVQDLTESLSEKVGNNTPENDKPGNDSHNDGPILVKSGYENMNTTMASGIGAGALALGNALGSYNAVTDSNLTKSIDAGYDAATGIVSQFSPVAGAAMQIVGAAGSASRLITGGNDQQTTADKILSSKALSSNIGAINDLYGKNSDAFSTDVEALETVGSSYGGTAHDIFDASQKADKKYGLFSSGARKRADETARLVAAKQGLMSNIADNARNQRFAVQSMGEQAGLAYSMMLDGGYNLKYTYAAKHGGLLEWNNTIELEWEPQVELNWELPTFKAGGSVEFIEELEWIPEFKDGGKTKEFDIPEIEETNQKNVIPVGALHKNKHHMEHAEGLTKKGIPVIDADGEQQAEIEHSEIIFTLEVTNKLEEYYEIFYSEESTNKEKEQAALDAGKLLVYQILENTEDRTGLIESCKNGGSLTLKKSADDLIDEMLGLIPKVVDEKKEESEKSSEIHNKDVKDAVKEIFKEVLIELLTQ